MANSYDYAIVGITLYIVTVFLFYRICGLAFYIMLSMNMNGCCKKAIMVECDHAPLNEDERSKPWLKKDSPPHKALTKIILDKRFLNTIPYYINFR